MKLPVQPFPYFTCRENTRKSHAQLFIYEEKYTPVLFIVVHCCQENIALVRRKAQCRCYRATMSKTSNRAHGSVPEDRTARTPVIVHATFAKSVISHVHRIPFPTSKCKFLMERGAQLQVRKDEEMRKLSAEWFENRNAKKRKVLPWKPTALCLSQNR